jgi:hypothetical protein
MEGIDSIMTTMMKRKRMRKSLAPRETARRHLWIRPQYTWIQRRRLHTYSSVTINRGIKQ